MLSPTNETNQRWYRYGTMTLTDVALVVIYLQYEDRETKKTPGVSDNVTNRLLGISTPNIRNVCGACHWRRTTKIHKKKKGWGLSSQWTRCFGRYVTKQKHTTYFRLRKNFTNVVSHVLTRKSFKSRYSRWYTYLSHKHHQEPQFRSVAFVTVRHTTPVK